MTDGNDPKNDLSSLMTLPLPEGAEPTEAPPEISVSTEPLQFESLDELSSAAASEAPLELPQEVSQEASAPPAELDLTTPVADPILPEPSLTVDPEQTQSSEPLDQIKTYSESIAQTAPVAAAFPFTLKIEGKLTPQESEKLISLVTRENMGLREVDLEPQIAEGKVLIPRISEYAGVLLIQALRGVSAKISFGPSDEIFSTPDTRDEMADAVPAQWTPQDSHAETQISQEIPVSTSSELPPFSKLETVDTVIASGLLSTQSVEAKSSNEYASLVEALIRELKFKARRRGANGIVSLQISLTPLTLPTDYRVTVSGSAVRAAKG